jgi:hypothetical protein
MIGRHSAIDKPDPVSRVKPPRTTIANTSPQQTSNQVATTLSRERLSESSFMTCERIPFRQARNHSSSRADSVQLRAILAA